MEKTSLLETRESTELDAALEAENAAEFSFELLEPRDNAMIIIGDICTSTSTSCECTSTSSSCC